MKLLVLALMAFVSFSGLASDHKMNHHGMKVEKDNKARKSLEAATKEQFLEALKVNESLHGAFFTYNAKDVDQYAKKLKSALSKIKNEDLLKLLKGTDKYLEKLTAEESQKNNNHMYNLVSRKLLTVLHTYNLGSTYNAYSCPMVQKYWIQNSTKMDKVHNPYASYMPHCGTKDSKY